MIYEHLVVIAINKCRSDWLLKIYQILQQTHDNPNSALANTAAPTLDATRAAESQVPLSAFTYVLNFGHRWLHASSGGGGAAVFFIRFVLKEPDRSAPQNHLRFVQ